MMDMIGICNPIPRVNSLTTVVNKEKADISSLAIAFPQVGWYEWYR
jgi:hypothetical protein